MKILLITMTTAALTGSILNAITTKELGWIVASLGWIVALMNVASKE